LKPDRIYLDYAATTPLRPDVLEAMQPYFADGYNASSVHAEGRRARAAVDAARLRIAAILGCKPKEIVFCASGSEADNLAITGAARARKGKHVVASAIEHHAVLRALDALRDNGYEISLVGADPSGIIDRDAFAAALRSDTAVAAVMHANNEIGTIQPIAELAALARARNITFVTDAVQAAGALELDVNALGVDCLTLSAHKFYGPKGVGALYVREGTPLEPLIHGGGQERGRRSGTENVPGIVGIAAALEFAEAERSTAGPRIRALRERFESAILDSIPQTVVNGRSAPRLPGISSLSFPGLAAEPLLIALDLAGIAASAGSACATGSLEPSHVIDALGLPVATVRATLRFSLGRATTSAEIERAATLLTSIVSAQREGAPLSV